MEKSVPQVTQMTQYHLNDDNDNSTATSTVTVPIVAVENTCPEYEGIEASGGTSCKGYIRSSGNWYQKAVLAANQRRRHRRRPVH